jgi:putative ABC transport system permease protein
MPDDDARRHDWIALVRARLGALRVDPMREREIVDELAQHVAAHYADLTAAGAADADALSAALAPLDPARVAAEIATATSPTQLAARLQPSPYNPPPPADGSSGLLVDLARDVRYAARLLRRAPGFAAVALLTLALGIGANTAIFSVLNAVLLRPLPYADPDRLVMIGARGTTTAPGNVGYATFLDWRERSRSFDAMALIRSWSPTLVANGEPERIAGMRVSAGFFKMLGVQPALGRDFTAAEDTPAGWRSVILSDGLWRRRFNADPSAVGRVITMNDLPFTIVGVMPRSFEPLISERFYQRADMWALVGYAPSLPYACRDCQHLKAIGRLDAGTTMETARADMDRVQAQLRREFPASYPPGETMAVVPLGELLTGGVRPALAVLMGAVGFVLLISCANVASLLLARIARRERDLALRAALGASRARIIRQLMVESALLALAGGALGVGVSAAAVPLLIHLAPTTISRLAGAGLDARVLAFSMVLSVATALLFGLVPAFRASRLDLQASLHGEGRKTGQAPTSLARRLLVAADVAMAVVLLIGAGLMIKSVGRLLGVNPGFDPDHVLSLQVSMVGQAYRKDDAVLAKIDAMVARLEALPGVESAAAAGQIPLGGNGDTWGFHIDGRPAGPQDPSVERYSVTPAYFAVMRIPLRRGRLFTDADRPGAENVMLVGERTSRTLWPGADPIGQHVRIGGFDGPPRTIVGIVGDVRHAELAAAPTMQMYLPQAQVTDSFLTMVIRSGGEPAALAADARRAIWSIASDVPVYQVAPLAELVAQSVGPRRFMMVLLELFGGVALLMTAIGVYGVISYTVSERTREIGIRAALGATPRDIVRLVVGGGLTVVCAGLAAGLLAAFAATRFLESSLFEVSATDPATFAGVAVVLLLVALAAQAVPIARAMRVDPAVALRRD